MNSSIYSWDIPWIMVFSHTSGGFGSCGFSVAKNFGPSNLGSAEIVWAAGCCSNVLAADLGSSWNHHLGRNPWRRILPHGDFFESPKKKIQNSDKCTIVVGIQGNSLVLSFLGWLHIYVVRWFSNHTLDDLPCLIASRYGTTISFFGHWTHVIMWQHPSILDHSTSVWKATANDPEKVSVQCNRHESSTWRMHQPSTSLTYYLGKLWKFIIFH